MQKPLAIQKNSGPNDTASCRVVCPRLKILRADRSTHRQTDETDETDVSSHVTVTKSRKKNY